MIMFRLEIRRLIPLLTGIGAALTLFASTSSAQVTSKPVVINAHVSGRCLNVEGASQENGANLIQFSCNGGANSQFRLEPVGDAFRVVANFSNKCLNVNNSSMANGEKIIQWPCSNDLNNLWALEKVGKFYRFRSKSSNKCLNVPGNTQDQAAGIVQWDCNGGNNELYSFGQGFIPPEQNVRLVSSNGNCADVDKGRIDDNRNLIQWPCKQGNGKGSGNQLLKISRRGAAYQIQYQHSGKCMDVAMGSNAENARIIQWPCSGAANQIWNVVRVAGGLQFRNQQTQKCLSLGTGSPLVQATCAATPAQTWTLNENHIVGNWSGIIGTPLVPVAIANLPNNKVMMWSAYDKFGFGGDNGYTQTGIFDLANYATTEYNIAHTQHDMFCPGTAFLPDGRLLVNGGSSAAKTSIYDFRNNTWTKAADMNVQRGYQATVPLEDGKVFTIGGSWSGPVGGKNGELWADGTNWKNLPGTPVARINGTDPGGEYRADNHAWLFAVGNGRVFHAGPSAQMNFFNTAGNGSFTAAGNRGDDNYAMDGNAVMYDIGKILKIGGAPAYQGRPATASSYLIDINAGVAVTKINPMKHARGFVNSIVYPDGKVGIFGGQMDPEPFWDQTPILEAETFNPADRTFTSAGLMDVPRTYHSVALLLPDARVFVGGGGLCGGCTTNHANLQIYTPPYLYNPNGTLASRPAINQVPQQFGFNQNINIATNQAVNAFSLVRLSAVTHSTNNDQRRVPLAIQSKNGNNYVVRSPLNAGIATPGYYMLFAMNAQGVPSVASIVNVR